MKVQPLLPPYSSIIIRQLRGSISFCCDRLLSRQCIADLCGSGGTGRHTIPGRCFTSTL